MGLTRRQFLKGLAAAGQAVVEEAVKAAESASSDPDAGRTSSIPEPEVRSLPSKRAPDPS